MDSLCNPDLRVSASRANKKAKARRQQLSEVPEQDEDYVWREEFLGNRIVQELDLDRPARISKPKPKTLPKPTKRSLKLAKKKSPASKPSETKQQTQPLPPVENM